MKICRYFFLETGRALIDDAGYLLTTVLANKRSNAGRRTMVIDAGVKTVVYFLLVQFGHLPHKRGFRLFGRYDYLRSALYEH